MSILNGLFPKPQAERAIIKIGNGGHSIDGYKLIDGGEKRAGLEGASLLVGYAPNWLSRELTRTDSKTLKALRDLGFGGYIEEVKVLNVRQARYAKTISISDLRAVIRYAAFEAKPPRQKAIALANGLMGVALEEYFDASFTKDLKRLNRMDSSFDSHAASISNPCLDLHQMNIDDTYNAPHDPGWQGSNPDNDRQVYRSPWD